MTVNSFFRGISQPDRYCREGVSPLLAGRGFRIARCRLPVHFAGLLGLRQPEQIRDFYRMLRRYSVRLLLRDLIIRGDDAELEQLCHYCSRAGASRILEDLAHLQLVENNGDVYRFKKHEDLRTGDLLEWYVAALLTLEFEIPALGNVSLRGGAAGGDYDVLGRWLDKLLFIEVKSAPPRGIHNPEIAEFLSRIRNIMPEIAVFLVDTHLRMKDKIVLMFEEELIRHNGIGSLRELPVQRVAEQIFHLNHTIYMMNSKRDLKSNFTVVFRDYLKYHIPGTGQIFRE